MTSRQFNNLRIQPLPKTLHNCRTRVRVWVSTSLARVTVITPGRGEAPGCPASKGVGYSEIVFHEALHHCLFASPQQISLTALASELPGSGTRKRLASAGDHRSLRLLAPYCKEDNNEQFTALPSFDNLPSTGCHLGLTLAPLPMRGDADRC